MLNWFGPHASSSRRRRQAHQHSSFRPRLEALEDRLTPATIIVNTNADDVTPKDGSVSLREAITAINAGSAGADNDVSNQTPGTFGMNDTIKFDLLGAGLQTINVGSSVTAATQALPALTKPVFIDGYSQPGSSPNTLATGNNAVLLIELNGSATASGSGLTLSGGSSTVQGLVINRFENDGILSTSAGGNTLTGNFIGTDAAGLGNQGNGSDGVLLQGSNNTVGGTTPASRNVIAFNAGAGVEVASNAGPGDVILGNDVFSNGGLGIALNGNGLQNLPTLSPVVFTSTSTTVRGTLSSLPNTTFRIELFANDSLDPSGAGEGQQFLGFIDVTTDASGTASFHAVLDIAVNPSCSVTATATATATGVGANTTGFSAGGAAITPLFAFGTDTGPSMALAYHADGSMAMVVTPFDGFDGSVATATGDVNGDGYDDVITAASDSPGGHVKVFDGRTSQPIMSFLAFPGFDGPIAVAAVDVNDDGHADVIVAASDSPGGHVKVFDGATGALIMSFFAFPGYSGSLDVAAGDVTGDGRTAVVVAATAAGANGHVKAFSVDGATLESFFALPGSNRTCSITTSDLDGDGRAEIVVGQGGVGASRITLFGPDASVIRTFDRFPGFNGGVTLTSTDLNNDGRAELIVTAGISFTDGVDPHTEVFDGASLGLLQSFFPYDAIDTAYSSYY